MEIQNNHGDRISRPFKSISDRPSRAGRKSTDGKRVLLGNDLRCHNFKRERTNKENNYWTKSGVQESKNQ